MTSQAQTAEVPAITAQYSEPAPLAFSGLGASPALQIMLDDKLFDRAKMIAKYLSEAEGFVPQHLLGKTAACFAVVTRALTWKLDPYAVAQCTYQTPGGRVGFEGKLCQAILENSGKLEGPVKYEHYGDWTKVHGKFQIRKSDRGKDYAAPTWGPAEAKGLGVIVRAKVKGEAEPREWQFDLIQAFPLNSTLWATDPKTQICYAAVRRFGNVAAPGLFMGVPFDREDLADPASQARDITPPRPQRSTYTPEPAAEVIEAGPAPEPTEPPAEEEEKPFITTTWGEKQPMETPADLAIELGKMFAAAGQAKDAKAIDTLVENNKDVMMSLPEDLLTGLQETITEARNLIALGNMGKKAAKA